MIKESKESKTPKSKSNPKVIGKVITEEILNGLNYDKLIVAFVILFDYMNIYFWY